MSSVALLSTINTVFCICQVPHDVAVMRFMAYSTGLKGSMVDLNEIKQKELYTSVFIKSLTVGIFVGNRSDAKPDITIYFIYSFILYLTMLFA